MKASWLGLDPHFQRGEGEHASTNASAHFAAGDQGNVFKKVTRSTLGEENRKLELKFWLCNVVTELLLQCSCLSQVTRRSKFRDEKQGNWNGQFVCVILLLSRNYNVLSQVTRNWFRGERGNWNGNFGCVIWLLTCYYNVHVLSPVTRLGSGEKN